jgi:hypothetical protein
LNTQWGGYELQQQNLNSVLKDYKQALLLMIGFAKENTVLINM